MQPKKPHSATNTKVKATLLTFFILIISILIQL
jgi:hypothetical protein